MSHSISPPPTKRRKLSRPANDTSRTDTTSPPDNPATIRIFAWNINGITPFLQPPITSFFNRPSNSDDEKPEPGHPSLRAFLKRHHWPHMLLLQEVKISPQDKKTQSAVQHAVNPETVRDEGPRYEVHFTLPRDPHNAGGFGGKVYGIASIIRKDLSADGAAKLEVREVDWDLEGRIHVIEMQTKRQDDDGARKLAVLNVYAVNGTDNPYRDPKTGTVVDNRHARKIAFHKLLLNECLSLEKEGRDVVIAGDLNVARGPLDGYPRLRTSPMDHEYNRADFNTKFFGDAVKYHGQRRQVSLNAVDVWRAMKGDERRRYTYFSRGREWGSSCDRVDLIIVSGRLWEEGRVVGTGILDSMEERGPSDHVPLWVEVGRGSEKAAESGKESEDSKGGVGGNGKDVDRDEKGKYRELEGLH